jgi:hypothetical protein
VKFKLKKDGLEYQAEAPDIESARIMYPEFEVIEPIPESGLIAWLKKYWKFEIR